MKYKLVLINPKPLHYPKLENHFLPPLVFGIIKSLTPKEWDITIIDEFVEDFKVIEADLIGISAMILTANRAYEIAELYRSRGVKTVIGGVHPSSVPEEAEKFSDSIVIGEVENIWGGLIEDFENNNLKKRYYGTLVNSNDFISPNLDNYRKNFFSYPIETSRGCLNSCGFCGIHVPYKQPYRRKPLINVIDEIRKSKNRNIFFIDNNFYNKDDDYLEELFSTIIKQKITIRWMAGVTTNFFLNEKLLKLASRSGCKILFTGLEADNANSLKELCKSSYGMKGSLFNHYSDIIDKCHKNHILFSSNFIIGLESDNCEIIKNRINFFQNLNIDVCSAGLLTPFPGTKFYDKLNADNKILFNNYPSDWNKYDYTKYVFVNNNLAPKDAEFLIKKANESVKKKKYIKSFINIKRISNIKYLMEYNKHLGL